MGYTTNFNGQFVLDKPLRDEHTAYLRQFAETRRMQRDAAIVATLHDIFREAAELPIGDEGAYFVGGGGFHGQDDDASVCDHNRPPSAQPGLWCQWIPTENGNGIAWDEGEKFYCYVEWLTYIIDHFLKPWGYNLNGEVEWRGEEWNDTGIIAVKDNVVKTRKRRQAARSR